MLLKRFLRVHNDMIVNFSYFLDPQRLARTQENMVLSRRRMQEEVNAKAAQRAEKMKEVNMSTFQPDLYFYS